ncbi:Ribosomal protein S8 [Cynara cardunculus var. scolymus]|uniref:Ribosomal protein S8 n=1 Tax=Cynara cardunculus var. scolymus TaxID=59895 RepID=A0A118JZ94_CYNCS|nr:Ribosomal protein S8 [Cynara cardunculus var. scolymus]
MGSDTISDIITSIRNANMYRKSVVRVASTNISQSIVKILLREGFIKNVRKQQISFDYPNYDTHGERILINAKKKHALYNSEEPERRFPGGLGKKYIDKFRFFLFLLILFRSRCIDLVHGLTKMCESSIFLCHSMSLNPFAYGIPTPFGSIH